MLVNINLNHMSKALRKVLGDKIYRLVPAIADHYLRRNLSVEEIDSFCEILSLISANDYEAVREALNKSSSIVTRSAQESVARHPSKSVDLHNTKVRLIP